MSTATREMSLDEVVAKLPEDHRARMELRALRGAVGAAFGALRHVEDWQWGKREADLREDQLLSAETVRPMITSAIAEIKAAWERSASPDRPCDGPST